MFKIKTKAPTHDSSDRHNVARARRVQFLSGRSAAAKHLHHLHRLALGALASERVQCVARTDAARVDAAGADLVCVCGGGEGGGRVGE